MVEVRGITKRFGNLTAVDGLSFKAVPGEIFGLIGPNGAGKSTTIKMIMNILAPDSGTILFSGRPMREQDKARIGYLPEERGLYRKVKVNDILLYLADLKGKGAAESQARINHWLGRFDLMEWKYRKVEELSKGMAQKVQFIASIAHDPELLFFDEPFAGLDPVSSDFLLSCMRDLARDGKTILFSTHIMDHAEKICSSILLINHGREVLTGTMSEVKERYGRNSVTIEFDGDIEFVKSLPFVERVVSFPRWIEVELKDRKYHDDLFAALSGRVSVSRYEIMAPSLHKIFIDIVGQPEESQEDAE